MKVFPLKLLLDKKIRRDFYSGIVYQALSSGRVFPSLARPSVRHFSFSPPSRRRRLSHFRRSRFSHSFHSSFKIWNFTGYSRNSTVHVMNSVLFNAIGPSAPHFAADFLPRLFPRPSRGLPASLLLVHVASFLFFWQRVAVRQVFSRFSSRGGLSPSLFSPTTRHFSPRARRLPVYLLPLFPRFSPSTREVGWP